MFKKLDHVIVFVKNMDRATAFYRDVLGMSVNFSSPDFTSVQFGDVWLGLHSTDEDIHVGNGAIMYLTVDNIAETTEYLKSKETKIGEKQDVPGGTFLPFNDSEGNLLGAYEHKA